MTQDKTGTSLRFFGEDDFVGKLEEIQTSNQANAKTNYACSPMHYSEHKIM
jgi:hypothetical protein